MSDSTDRPVYRQSRFARPEGATELLVIRHGESAPADPDRAFALVDGQGDPELAPEGREQAQRVGERLADEPIAAIYVSKLRRTSETAAPLAGRLGLDPILDPDIHEVHLGDWEGGLFRRHAAEGHPAVLRMHAEQRWDAIPRAEDRDVFRERILRGFTRIADAHPDEQVAVVVHGGVIGALLSIVTGADDFAFNGADNASIHHVVRMPAAPGEPGREQERWAVRRFNDTNHLRRHFTTAAEHLT
ncbi:MAG: histidine phosphatase family protein [Actinomycetota bacterium]